MLPEGSTCETMPGDSHPPARLRRETKPETGGKTPMKFKTLGTLTGAALALTTTLAFGADQADLIKPNRPAGFQ